MSSARPSTPKTRTGTSRVAGSTGDSLFRCVLAGRSSDQSARYPCPHFADTFPESGSSRTLLERVSQLQRSGFLFGFALFAVVRFARHQATLPGVPTGTCTPTQLHGVQVRHATSAHCCSGLSGGAHGGVPGPPHTAGSADAAPTPMQPPTLIDAATAPIISNRFNMSSPAFCRAYAGNSRK